MLNTKLIRAIEIDLKTSISIIKGLKKAILNYRNSVLVKWETLNYIKEIKRT